MKITSKKTDDLNQVLTVNVDAADYETARKKKLNEYQRRADIPGFRKGKVPASMIEKFYGESALGDSVNTVVMEALQKYVDEKKLNIIGEPLPCEDKKEQEWKAGNDFEFKFDIALNPQVKIAFEKGDEVTSYNITVTEAEKKKLLDAYRKQQEAIAKAAKEKGEEAPAQQTDEELGKKVSEELANEYKQAAEFRLEKDIRDFCIKKAGVKLPEKFLRRWLVAVNEGKFTEEQIDKDFEGFLADYRWQLVMGQLLKDFGLKIEEADLKEEARNFARYQYAMYGMNNLPDDILDNFAKDMMQDRNGLQRLVENAQNRKVIAAVKEKLTIKSKKISAEKFRELK